MRELRWYIPSNATRPHALIVRGRMGGWKTACGLLVTGVQNVSVREPVQRDACAVCWEAFEKWRAQCSEESSSGQSVSRPGGGSANRTQKPPQW